MLMITIIITCVIKKCIVSVSVCVCVCLGTYNYCCYLTLSRSHRVARMCINLHFKTRQNHTKMSVDYTTPYIIFYWATLLCHKLRYLSVIIPARWHVFYFKKSFTDKCNAHIRLHITYSVFVYIISYYLLFYGFNCSAQNDWYFHLILTVKF